MEKISYARFKDCVMAYEAPGKGEQARAQRLTYAFYLLGSVKPFDVNLAIGFVQGYLQIDTNHF